MYKLNKKGFTLIEMLVVIAIIAVLVSIIIPVVGNSTDKAKAATDAANLRSALAEIQIQVLDGDIDKPATGEGTWTAAKVTTGDPVVSTNLQNMKSKTDGDTYALYYKVASDGSVDVMFSTDATEANGHKLEHYQTIAEKGKTE